MPFRIAVLERGVEFLLLLVRDTYRIERGDESFFCDRVHDVCLWVVWIQLRIARQTIGYEAIVTSRKR